MYCFPFWPRPKRIVAICCCAKDFKVCWSMGRDMRWISILQEVRRYEMVSCALSVCSNCWLGAGKHSSCGELRAALRQPLWRACGVGCCIRSEEHTSELQSLRHLVC